MAIKQSIKHVGGINHYALNTIKLVMAAACTAAMVLPQQAYSAITQSELTRAAAESVLAEYGYLDADAFYFAVESQWQNTDATAIDSFTASATTGRGAYAGDQLTPDNRLIDLAGDAFNLSLYQCLRRTYNDNIRLGQILQVQCADSGIDSLAGLEAFTHLQTLDLHNTINSRFPNSFTDISPLATHRGEPVSPRLTMLNLAGLDLSSDSALFSSLNQELYKLHSLRHLNLAASKLDQLPDFLGFGGRGLALRSLDLRDNSLERLDALEGLQAINYLWLDHNPLGNAAIERGSALSRFPHMISLSLTHTGLSGAVQAAGLPREVGFLDVRENITLTQFALPWNSPTRVVFTLDLRGNEQLSCRGVDATQAWFNRQPIQDYCVGDPLLGEECFLGPMSLQRPQPCTPDATEKFTVSTDKDGQYRARWQPAPAAWEVNLYKIWYLSSEGGMLQSIDVPLRGQYSELSAAELSHTFSLPVLNNGRYLFALQACHDSGVERCGILSLYTPPAGPVRNGQRGGQPKP